MKKTIIYFLLFTVCSAETQMVAQRGISKSSSLGVIAGYDAYSFVNPGFQVGLEKILGSTRSFDLLASLALHTYFESDVQSGVRLNLYYGSRVTAPLGIFFENYIWIGYEHYFFTRKTFVFNNGIATTEEKWENKPAFSPGIALGLGYDLSKVVPLGILLFARPTLSWRIPDRNLVFQNVCSIEAGIIWYPNLGGSK